MDKRGICGGEYGMFFFGVAQAVGVGHPSHFSTGATKDRYHQLNQGTEE